MTGSVSGGLAGSYWLLSAAVSTNLPPVSDAAVVKLLRLASSSAASSFDYSLAEATTVC